MRLQILSLTIAIPGFMLMIMPNYYGDGLCNAISPAQRTNKSSHIATTGPENAMKFTQAACL